MADAQDLKSCSKHTINNEKTLKNKAERDSINTCIIVNAQLVHKIDPDFDLFADT